MLFATQDLIGVLEAKQWDTRQAIDKWDPDELLPTAEADVAEYLVNEYSVVCPVLHRDQAEALPVSEEVQTVRGIGGGQYQQRLTKIAIAVPFEGEKDVFKYRASTFTGNPPHGQVRNRDLVLTWVGSQQSPHEPATVRRYFENELDRIEQHLGWSRGDVERHNASVRTMVSSSLAARKAQLLADRQLEAGLGFPVRRRPDATKYAIPVTRRKIEASRRPVASGPFQPEPVLPQAQDDPGRALAAADLSHLRDTKAALLVFIRTGQPSSLIEKAINEIEQHPNYKRTVRTSDDGERYDFIFHANGDLNREIQLAFMPFALLDVPGPQ